MRTLEAIPGCVFCVWEGAAGEYPPAALEAAVLPLRREAWGLRERGGRVEDLETFLLKNSPRDDSSGSDASLVRFMLP